VTEHTRLGAGITLQAGGLAVTLSYTGVIISFEESAPLGPAVSGRSSAPLSGRSCLPSVTGARCPWQARPQRIPALPAPRSI